jgi:hypothetical protein
MADVIAIVVDWVGPFRTLGNARAIAMFSAHGRVIIPRHEFVAAKVAVAGGEPGERVGEPSLWIDAIELTSLDHAGDHGPMMATVVRRDLMMPGVWASRWGSHIRFTRCLGAQRWLSPISSTKGPGPASYHGSTTAGRFYRGITGSRPRQTRPAQIGLSGKTKYQGFYRARISTARRGSRARINLACRDYGTVDLGNGEA